MTDDRLIDLLHEQHDFPCTYTFKVIGDPADGFIARVVAAVREELSIEMDPPHSVRESSKGNHVAVTLEPELHSAAMVLAVHERIAAVRGVRAQL